MAERKLNVIIAGDDRLGGPLNSATGHVNRFGSRFRSFAGGMVAGMGTAFAVDRIVTFGGALLTLGTQVEVTGIKADTVFGESAAQVRGWADHMNEALGMSDESLVGLAANMGDLLVPMGFTESHAASMSQQMGNLSGALSAWSGGTRSAAEVMGIFQSALLGEREELKGLGISITEADVAARLAEKGQEDLTGAALAQAEAQATLELLYEKSTDAQQAWNDGSMENIKAQNELKAAWEDAKVALAEKLLPVMQSAFRWLQTYVIPVVQHLIHVFDEEGLAGVMRSLGGMFQLMWPSIREALGDILVNLGNAIAEWTPPILERLGQLAAAAGEWLIEVGIPAFVEWVEQVWPPFAAAMARLWGRVGEWIVTDLAPFLAAKYVEIAHVFWDWLVTDVIPQLPGKLWAVANTIAAWIRNEAAPFLAAEALQLAFALTDWLSKLPSQITTLAAGMWDGIWTAFKSVINRIIGAWNNLSFSLPTITLFGLDIGGGSIETPNLPTIRQAGAAGITGRTSAAEELAGGPTVIINVAGSVQTERDLAQTVRNELIRYQATSGVPLFA